MRFRVGEVVTVKALTNSAPLWWTAPLQSCLSIKCWRLLFFCCSHSNLCFMYLIIIIDVIPAPQFWFWNTLRTTIWATRLWRWQILVWLGSGIEPRRWAQQERMPGWPLRSSAPQLSPRAVMFGGGHQEMCVSVCVCDLATPKASHSTLQPSWQVFRISYYPCVTLLKKIYICWENSPEMI